MVKYSCICLGIKRLLQILVFCLFVCFVCAFYFESCVVWMEAEVAGCSIGYLWSRKVLSKCFRYPPSCAWQMLPALLSVSSSLGTLLLFLGLQSKPQQLVLFPCPHRHPTLVEMHLENGHQATLPPSLPALPSQIGRPQPPP